MKKKTQAYLVELFDPSTMRASFPHTPPDATASISDYLEDKLANGWRLKASFGDASHGTWFVFEPEATT